MSFTSKPSKAIHQLARISCSNLFCLYDTMVNSAIATTFANIIQSPSRLPVLLNLMQLFRYIQTIQYHPHIARTSVATFHYLLGLSNLHRLLLFITRTTTSVNNNASSMFPAHKQVVMPFLGEYFYIKLFFFVWSS